jgi:hypothetical protein
VGAGDLFFLPQPTANTAALVAKMMRSDGPVMVTFIGNSSMVVYLWFVMVLLTNEILLYYILKIKSFY